VDGTAAAAGVELDDTPDVGGVAPNDPVERERTRLAYAIHDGLTQVVTASVLELEWQARRTELDPHDAVEALSLAAAELRNALDEIRDLLADLSPRAGQPYQPLDELIRRVIDRWKLRATWSLEGELETLPRPVYDVATSVIRESVANAAKHSASKVVGVDVRTSSDGVEVRIEDGGRGFRPEGAGLQEGHLGLAMMRRRVEQVRGTLEIESSPGHGTRVVARLPVIDQEVTS
jgi:signal transduction histidine kinase